MPKKLKLKPKSPRFSLIESTFRNTTMYGYCRGDRDPVVISADKDVALDFIYSLIHKEAHPQDKLKYTSAVEDPLDALEAIEEEDE